MDELKSILKIKFNDMFSNGKIDIEILLNEGILFLEKLYVESSNYSEREGKKKVIKSIEDLFYEKYQEIFTMNFENRIIIKNFYDGYLNMKSYSFIFNKFYKIIGNISLSTGNPDITSINLDNFEIEGNLKIHGKSQIISLEKGKVSGSLEIFGHIIINQEIDDDKKIILKDNYIGVINISDIKIQDNFNIGANIDMYLEGNTGKLNLGKLKDIGELIIDNHKGELSLEEYMKFDDRFIIQNSNLNLLKVKNSDLGKTTFNGVEIDKLYLENTTLNDCIFNGVEFSKDYNLSKKYKYFDEEKKKEVYSKNLSNKQLKDNYRQLKFVMDKNGNYTEANKFYEKEMEYHLKSLNIKKKGLWKTFKELFDGKFLGEKTKKKGEEIVLLFGYNINEFGNNWIKPLFLIILLALISTIFDGVSTLFGYSFGNNYLGDFVFSILIIVSLYVFEKINGTKIDKIIGNFFENKFVVIIFLFLIVIVFLIIPNFDSLKVFGNLLNPLYLKEKGVSYNGIEILGLTLYKTIYGILLWHLVVALKRTTKR